MGFHHGMSQFVLFVKLQSGNIQNLHRVVKPPYYNLHIYIYLYSQLLVAHNRVAIYPIYRCETSMWLCLNVEFRTVPPDIMVDDDVPIEIDIWGV